jgi:glucose dehydrogenase
VGGAGLNELMAVGGGRAYLLTKDDHRIAINAQTGAVDDNVVVANARADDTESAPALYDDGLVFVGSAGGDSGVRGYEEARNAATGALVWKDYATPGLGSGGWVSHAAQGGGATWMNPTPGPDGLLYDSTGNPSPDLYGQERPGADKWTDSIIAVNMKTGKRVWAYQMVPHDMWDYDSASPPVVFKTASGWVVGEADKGGYWTELNALTGSPVTLPEPFVTENHVMPPTNGTYVLNWPGVLGGSEWSPVSYDPRTQYAYVQGNNIPMLETGKDQDTKPTAGGLVFGTDVREPPGQKQVPTGTFTAFNVGAGTAAWQDKMVAPTTGGIVTTAGGIALDGVDNGAFEVMNAANGKALGTTNVGISIGRAPAVNEVNGKEYVLLPRGGSLNFQYSKDGYHAGWIAFALPSM